MLCLKRKPQVHSARSPYMGFVLEGEIDFRIGITAEIARTRKGDLARSDYALLGIPQSTFAFVRADGQLALVLQPVILIPGRAGK
jgi:hypothetical protein